MIYLVSLVLHVIATVLGVGQIAAVAIASLSEKTDQALLRRLTLLATASLVVVLLTGVSMVAVTQGVYVHATWFRVSMVLFLLIGAGLGQIRRALRKGSALALRNWAFSVCVLVAAVVALMEAKPA